MSMQIEFDISYKSSLNNIYQYIIRLDKSFHTKSVIVKKPNKVNKICFQSSKIYPESRDNPCLIIESYSKRNQTWIRSHIFKQSLYVLKNEKNIKIANSNFIISIQNFKITGKFDHIVNADISDINNEYIDNYSQSVFLFLDKFKQDRLQKVAIFYRDDLLHKMDMLSQLIVTPEICMVNTNPEAWLNLYEKMVESIDVLQDMELSTINRRIMKRPRKITKDSYHFVDLIMYIPTKGYNYRSDFPRDNYSEPYFNKIGDCEDLTLAAIHFYYYFVNCKLPRTDKYLPLITHQDMAMQFIPFFTFCITGGAKAGTSGIPNAASGHICAYFISKYWFMQKLEDKKLVALMQKDKSIKKISRKYLIGESTNLVSPYIEDYNFTGFDPDTLSVFQKMLQITKQLNFKNLSDYATVRVISNPNATFYEFFGLIFTSYFYNMMANASYVPYGFVCATKGEKNKLHYGISFEDFDSFDPNIAFYTLPPIPKDHIRMSRINSRYQIPPPTFKMVKGKFERSESSTSPMFYSYNFNTIFFKELENYKLKDYSAHKLLAYAFISDEDIFYTDLQIQILNFLKENNIKIKYIRQKLNYDTNTHLFLFYLPSVKHQNVIIFQNRVARRYYSSQMS